VNDLIRTVALLQPESPFTSNQCTWQQGEEPTLEALEALKAQ
jgi:hypothetical protein